MKKHIHIKGFYLIEEDGLTAPVAICMKCRERITKERPGILMWIPDGERKQAVIVHKVTCDDRRYHSWNDLDVEWFYLGHNIGIGDDELVEVKKRAERLTEL